MSSFPDVTDRNVQYPNRYHTQDPVSGAEEIIDITPQPGTGVEGTVLDKAFFDGVKAYIDTNIATTVNGNTIYGGTVVTNFNTIGRNGFYTGLGTTTGAPDASYSWFVLHQNSNTGTVSAYQRAIAYDNTKLIVFERVKTGSSWSSWYYTGANDFLVATPAVAFTSSTLSHVIDLPWSITAPQHKITLTFVDLNGKYVIRTHEFNDVAFFQTGIADDFFNGTDSCLYTVTATTSTSVTVSFLSLTNDLTLASISMR